MSKVSKAVEYMKTIANDPKHGYSQLNRWGSPDTYSDYDCSSLVISAYEAAGIKVKTAGATYTGNMYNAFIKCGFKDVTSQITLSSGKGLKAGDVLLNHTHHTAMMINTTQLAQASIDEKGGIMGGKVGDQTGQEIHIRSYYNYPWNVVLRYPETVELPVLDKSGYKKGSNTIGVLSFKQQLLYAKKKGMVSANMNNDSKFGSGTQKAVNELLKKWGYKQNGIAGEKFIKRLGEEMRK